MNLLLYCIGGVTWDLVPDLGVQLSLLLHTQRKGKLKPAKD